MRLIPLLSLLAFAPPAFARSLEGVSLPDNVEVAGKKLTLNGLGMREATVFKVDVYVAGLYIEAPTHDAASVIKAAGPTELIMHFVHAVDADDLQKAFREGFDKNDHTHMSALETRIKQLEAAMKDVAVGDEIVFVYAPDSGTEVRVKGKSAAQISGSDFAGALWSVFVGAEPPNAGLKSGLLGKS